MAAELKPVYLIMGSDRPKVELARRRLRARFPADATELLDASEAGGDDAVAACNAMGLFAEGGRLVLVDRIEEWNAPDATAVADYLGAPVPATTLALVGEGKVDAALAKACAKAGEVLTYEVVKKRLPDWVATQFKSAGAAADRDACRLLVELVGEDLHALELEVDKLAHWVLEDETITAADVEALVAPAAETPPWSLTDAWGRRDVGAVLSAAENVLDRSGDSRSGVLLRLAGTMSSHVGLVRACQRFEAEGLSPQAAATRLKKRSAYPVQKAYEQGRNYSAEELAQAIVRLAELDHALKGGSRLAGELELERALVDVTRAAPRA